MISVICIPRFYNIFSQRLNPHRPWTQWMKVEDGGGVQPYHPTWQYMAMAWLDVCVFGMFRRSQGHVRYLQIVSKCSFHLFRLHQKHLRLTCDSVAIPWPMALQVEPSGESQGGPGLGRKDPVSSVEVATRIIDRWAEEQTTSRFPDPIADVDGVWWCLGMLWCINIISSSIIIIIITYNYIRLSTVYMSIYYDILKILASFGIKANNVSTSTAWEPFTCRSMWM